MSVCEHGRRKSQCKECGGSSVCKHNRIKYSCKECVGTSICDHGRIKHNCKECGGSSICEHGREKYKCKECGGTSICEHGREKYKCKECGGSSICEHGREKYRCKECGGTSICEHGKIKYRCKQCGGISICEHNIEKSYCNQCGGSSICEHGKQKSKCKECDGASICQHNKYKQCCKGCGGSKLCKSAHCETYGNKKYNGYCLYCYIHLFPDQPNVRNYKTKEKDVVDRVVQAFPDFTWIADKKVQDGCSRRRPDLLLDMGSHIIIVEVDENAHMDYDCSCENKRLMELSQDLQHRPIVFIRFNPDGYTGKDGAQVKSCWKLNKQGVMQIMKSKQHEWEERIHSLKQQIQYWVDNNTEKTIEIVELFY